MRPIKPRPLPKCLDVWLRELADWDRPLPLRPRDARAILAALEWERMEGELNGAADIAGISPLKRRKS